MNDPVAYDRLATIYDLWISSRSREMDKIRDFYLARILTQAGSAAELGVGNGRLLIAAASAGRQIAGVDSSFAMLALARRHAEEAGVADRITLIQADFQDFILPEPAALIVIPFDSIGHLVTVEAKQRCIRQVFAQLVPGGRLIFDYDDFDPAQFDSRERRPFLHHVERDAKGQPVRMMWLTSILNREQRSREVHVWLEEIGANGAVSRQWVGAVENSWLGDAEEMRAMLTGAGFEVEDRLNSFAGVSTQNSKLNIWIARRPE